MNALDIERYTADLNIVEQRRLRHEVFPVLSMSVLICGSLFRRTNYRTVCSDSQPICCTLSSMVKTTCSLHNIKVEGNMIHGRNFFNDIYCIPVSHLPVLRKKANSSHYHTLRYRSQLVQQCLLRNKIFSVLTLLSSDMRQLVLKRQQ